nr:tetratricopeptide repeat protein [Saprospiraceae bacterium]
MNTKRIILIFAAVVAVAVIYFGCEKKDPSFKETESNRALSFQPTDFINIKRAVILDLSSERRNTIESLEFAIEQSQDEMEMAEYHKQLSSNWMQFGIPSLAGYHAERVAEFEMTAEAWSIAGSTYSICMQRAESESRKTLCGNRAVASFENAVSLDPNNLDNRLNLAVTLAEFPPENNPMSGITQLIELNRQNPDYVPALYNLGRLAIQTGQYQRAIERLERAFELEPDNQRVVCLMPIAYSQLGENEKAQRFAELCEQ